MPVLLARVDDRLIHGQVVHGWGRKLEPTLYAIVSDELRADAERAELYLFAVPEGATGRVVSVAEALAPAFREAVGAVGAAVGTAGAAGGSAGAATGAATVLLFPDLATPRRLAEGGFPLPALNLGGLHHAAGKHAALPYVYLDAADREQLRALARLGVRVTAQDLPVNAEHDAASLLGDA